MKQILFWVLWGMVGGWAFSSGHLMVEFCFYWGYIPTILQAAVYIGAGTGLLVALAKRKGYL